MKITTIITSDITSTVLSRAVNIFVDDCGYDVDAIKRHYLDYVLSIAAPYEDEVVDFIEERISLEDKENILSAFVTELEEQFHRDIVKALVKEDC